MSIVGFDFGTTNSLISLIRGDRAINCLDEDQRPIPSVVCYEGSKQILGRQAKERLSQAGLGVQGNIVRSPKMFLGRDSVFVEGTEKKPEKIVADVVSHVVSEAGRLHPEVGAISKAVVTIPVDMDGARRRALRDAFTRAGVRIVQFVHEPLAALYGFFRTTDLSSMLRRYDSKLVLVFDWGGGTLDLTLCRPVGKMVVQVKNDGTDDVGGDVFDEAIMNRLVKEVASTRTLNDSVRTQSGAQARLLDRCERAKIDLSSRSNVSIYVGSYFQGTIDDDFDYDLSQSALEDIVNPLLDKGFERIKRLLDDSGFAPEQVALCIATGGMSNMPAVKRRLHELFGPERVHIPDGTATLIAEGAAWIASDGAKLQLAKNVELEIARNSFLPLIKAGTAMPKEKDVFKDSFHLYCTDPRDGFAKLQFCTPRRAGANVRPNDPRACLDVLTVRVDAKARAFHERLELDVRINDDLIFEAHARSLNMRDQDYKEVHNLEFGLEFPEVAGMASATPTSWDGASATGANHSAGTISVRANVSNEEDISLVPGEFLYQYNRVYFDRRANPPALQENEKLYYEPCSLCGLASNDPACRCAARLR